MDGIEIIFIEENLATGKLPDTLKHKLKELFLDYGIFITINELDEKVSQGQGS